MWDPLGVCRLRTFSERSHQGRFWLPWAGSIRSIPRSVIICPSGSYRICLMLERCREYFHRASILWNGFLWNPFYTNCCHIRHTTAQSLYLTWGLTPSIVHSIVWTIYTKHIHYYCIIPNNYNVYLESSELFLCLFLLPPFPDTTDHFTVCTMVPFS